MTVLTLFFVTHPFHYSGCQRLFILGLQSKICWPVADTEAERHPSKLKKYLWYPLSVHSLQYFKFHIDMFKIKVCHVLNACLELWLFRSLLNLKSSRLSLKS